MKKNFFKLLKYSINRNYAICVEDFSLKMLLIFKATKKDLLCLMC